MPNINELLNPDEPHTLAVSDPALANPEAIDVDVVDATDPEDQAVVEQSNNEIVTMMQSLEQLIIGYTSLRNAGGMSRIYAMECKQLFPEFDNNRHINAYTPHLSKVHYESACESFIDRIKTIFKAIVDKIKAIYRKGKEMVKNFFARVKNEKVAKMLELMEDFQKLVMETNGKISVYLTRGSGQYFPKSIDEIVKQDRDDVFRIRAGSLIFAYADLNSQQGCPHVKPTEVRNKNLLLTDKLKQVMGEIENRGYDNALKIPLDISYTMTDGKEMSAEELAVYLSDKINAQRAMVNSNPTVVENFSPLHWIDVISEYIPARDVIPAIDSYNNMWEVIDKLVENIDRCIDGLEEDTVDPNASKAMIGNLNALLNIIHHQATAMQSVVRFYITMYGELVLQSTWFYRNLKGYFQKAQNADTKEIVKTLDDNCKKMSDLASKFNNIFLREAKL